MGACRSHHLYNYNFSSSARRALSHTHTHKTKINPQVFFFLWPELLDQKWGTAHDDDVRCESGVRVRVVYQICNTLGSSFKNWMPFVSWRRQRWLSHAHLVISIWFAFARTRNHSSPGSPQLNAWWTRWWWRDTNHTNNMRIRAQV